MMPPGWKCPRRVGFLFPHPCTRVTPEGCPDCQNGQINDPYRQRDRYYYSDYDTYDYSLTGYALGSLADRLDPRFTEADGESLVESHNGPDDATGGFENDLSGS
jgi:hypothetical protein